MFSFLRRTSLYILAIPVLFTVLGAASNQLVLIKNGDTFPVMVNDKKLQTMTDPKEKSVEIKFTKPNPAEQTDGTIYLDDTHVAMTSYTHLNFLADVFDLKDGIYSIGDFLLMLGEWMSVFAPFLFVFDTTRKLAKS
jgi:Family of unknown function (DUF5317)